MTSIIIPEHSWIFYNKYEKKKLGPLSPSKLLYSALEHITSKFPCFFLLNYLPTTWQAKFQVTRFNILKGLHNMPLTSPANQILNGFNTSSKDRILGNAVPNHLKNEEK